MMVWSFSKKGNYIIKSGYYVGKQLRMEESNTGETPVQRTNGSLWSQIWKANVPNKIKFFYWRACLNILPTQDNLVGRRHSVASVRMILNQFCMCFGVVGWHRMFR